ncbi:hypothetical protein WDA79_05890 [Streptomyces sp. A475]
MAVRPVTDTSGNLDLSVPAATPARQDDPEAHRILARLKTRTCGGADE